MNKTPTTARMILESIAAEQAVQRRILEDCYRGMGIIARAIAVDLDARYPDHRADKEQRPLS